jgi:hypothetical protein
MCIDYIDLNQRCPKDPFPLPRIDQVVDSTAESVLLCFLDCYSGYHQIALKVSDQDKMTFITPHGIYCYTAMTFGLKNDGATYKKAILSGIHPGSHARKEEDGLLLEFLCNPIRTRSV